LPSAQAQGKTDNKTEELEGQLENLDEEAIQLIRKGRHLEGAERLEKEVRIAERLYSKDKYPNGHATLAAILSKLGTVYRSSGKYAQAESLLKKALATYRALCPPERYPNGHPSLANGLHDLALMMSDQGRYSEAETIYREALVISRKARGDSPAETAALLNSLAVNL
jgi:tetratricopeptide (TPR) repeat protein